MKMWKVKSICRYQLQLLFFWILFCLLLQRATAADWLPFGPYGGDARSFAADPKDPKHLYLGTTNGWMYESQDGGSSWKRLARVGERDDLVLDHIQVDHADPKHLLAGMWVLGHADGGLFQSRDEGKSWSEVADLKGQSVRSLAEAMSDAKIFVAGTLEGVYRSTDGGDHWKLISPEGSKEIHEVESVAIDPKDPSIIYVGTWHLPWKTSDGGEHWNNIKEGVIDDSDVFSIILDPEDPKVVYASACSGIYKSDNGGDKFQKVQGIPSTARRTRVLMQDPKELEIVYAGTTEGLFRTSDAGKGWTRTTGPEVIVNDVFVDPSNTKHVLLATDRGGVLVSEDGGSSFQPSNTGFTVRQVASYVADSRSPSTVYISVLNDKGWGGVFESKDGSLSWVQQSTGLGGRDVFSLGQASDGTVIAGSNHGIFRLKDSIWSRVTDVDLTVTPAAEKTTPVTSKRVKVPQKGRRGGRTSAKRASGETDRGAGTAHAAPSPRGKVTAPKEAFDGSTFSIATVGDKMYAATSRGLLRSGTAGESWKAIFGEEAQSAQFVAGEGSLIAAATLHAIVRSTDGGATWAEAALPQGLTQITAMTVDDSGHIWVGGREGVWISPDGGASWTTVKGLFVQDASDIFFDRAAKRIYLAANKSTHLTYMVQLPELTVRFWDTGWYLRFVRPMGDHLVGATLFDGMVVQPRMVDSLEAKPMQ